MAEGGKEPPTTPATPEVNTSPEVDENIPYPTVELYRHTILRGANLGSVLSLILAPPYLAYKGVWRQPMEFLRRTGSITAKGMVGAMSLARRCKD